MLELSLPHFKDDKTQVQSGSVRAYVGNMTVFRAPVVTTEMLPTGNRSASVVKPSQFAQAQKQGDATGTDGRGLSDHILWSFIVDLNFSTELPHKGVWLGRVCNKVPTLLEGLPLEQGQGCGVLSMFWAPAVVNISPPCLWPGEGGTRFPLFPPAHRDQGAIP